ncbi:MAG: MerR family redox-sensitive transcriptional activator SoxR [Paracoccaceae bacterium]|jgi:MerR family redox-sensitive transcriptional activator SoxR
MHRNDILSIGEIASRTGIAVSAIRYYEDERLIRPTRSPSGHRRFKRADIRRITFIKIVQKFGFSLPEIREVLNRLPDGRTPTAKDWASISRQIRVKLEQRIVEMETLRDKLDGCIGCGCLSLKKCALYNTQDISAADGPGANYVTT